MKTAATFVHRKAKGKSPLVFSNNWTTKSRVRPK